MMHNHENIKKVWPALKHDTQFMLFNHWMSVTDDMTQQDRKGIQVEFVYSSSKEAFIRDNLNFYVVISSYPIASNTKRCTKAGL